jgi:hypothetical protein
MITKAVLHDPDSFVQKASWWADSSLSRCRYPDEFCVEKDLM